MNTHYRVEESHNFKYNPTAIMTCIITGIQSLNENEEFRGYRVETTHGYVSVSISNCTPPISGIRLSRGIGKSTVSNVHSLIGASIIGIHTWRADDDDIQMERTENDADNALFVSMTLDDDEPPLVITMWTNRECSHHRCTLEWNLTTDKTHVTTHAIELL